MRWIEFGPAARQHAAPSFELALPDGVPVTRSQFRSKRRLILVFARDLSEPGARRLIQSLAARSNELEEIPASAYVISPDTAPTTTPLPVLNDRHGRVSRAYRELLPPDEQLADGELFVFILDHYGAPGFAGHSPSEPDEAAEAIVTRTWGLAYECPE